MVKILFVYLPDKLDAEFRIVIRKVKGDHHGNRTDVTREIIAEWVEKNRGV